MKMKKIIAAIAAAAMATAMLTVTASAETIGTAGIYMADETWGAQQYWGDSEPEKNMGIKSAVNATITGDGTYTATLEFEQPMAYGQFFGLCTDIAGTGDGIDGSTFTDYPDAVLAVTSVKADGVEVAGNAGAPDINDNGSMRVNIYNPWGEAEINYASDLEWTADCSKIEVTFTVTGMGVAAASDAAPAADTTTPSAGTGNTAAAAIVSVMAVAGVALVASRKRK